MSVAPPGVGAGGADRVAVRAAPHRVAARARPPRSSVAAHARSVSHLALRDHAAADAGVDRDSVLRAISRGVSRRRRAGRSADRSRARALERSRLLPPRASPARGARRRSSREHGGAFPRDAATIATLPGIGRSTAAAIAAFAFGARSAILDGNVKRVLARHRGIEGFPGAPKVEAEAVVESPNRCCRSDDIEAYTQGLMDLGATVCTRAAPRCGECPGRRGLRGALRTERVAELPSPRPAKALPHARGARAADRTRRRRSCSRSVRRSASGAGCGACPKCDLDGRCRAALQDALRRRRRRRRRARRRSSTASRTTG